MLQKIKTFLSKFLGTCGCISCYVAMFPISLLGVLGILGLATAGFASALNAYMASPFFNLILIVSIVLVIIGMIPGGTAALILSIIAGAIIFISMNIYMRPWLFIFAFFFLGIAQALGKVHQFGISNIGGIVLSSLPLIIVAIVLTITTYFISAEPSKAPTSGPMPPMSPQIIQITSPPSVSPLPSPMTQMQPPPPPTTPMMTSPMITISPMQMSP